MNKTIMGLFLVVIGILLASMFFIRDYHNIYWSHPSTFIIITIVGVFSSLYGSFLVGHGLLSERVGQGFVRRFLKGCGAIIAMLGGLLGLVSISMAIAISGTGYWGSPAPSDYNGDYLILGLQIFVFRISIIPTVIGGFLLGGVLQRGKRANSL
jgi:hypothetical protein